MISKSTKEIERTCVFHDFSSEELHDKNDPKNNNNFMSNLYNLEDLVEFGTTTFEVHAEEGSFKIL
jgi:hypothetical protein